MNIHWYGLLIGLAVSAGWAVVEQRLHGARHAGLARAIPTIIFFSIIGARLYHLITDFEIYADKSFLSWFEVWNGGLGIFGAVFGGLFGGFVYARLHHWSRSEWWLFSDTVFVVVPWMQTIGRVGNWINKELYGIPTQLPWGMTIAPDLPKVHPLFLYEMIGLIILGIVLSKQATFLGKGGATGLYFLGYGTLRFFLEFLRPDLAVRQDFSTTHWICFGCMIVGSMLLYKNAHSLVNKVER